jgi:hypothetical protein
LTGCSSAKDELEIYDVTNSTALSSTPIVPQQTVTSDAGVTRPSVPAFVGITSSNASASGITIRFDFVTSGNAGFGNCTLYGDNVNLIINYSVSHGRRGQVIIGMNVQPDGNLRPSWAYNVDLLSDNAAPVDFSKMKFAQNGRETTPDMSALEGEGRKVTKVQ